MKETDLMIGDYLYWGKDKVVKVQMLRKYGDNFGIDVVYNDSVNLYFCTDNDDIYSYSIDDLKPIPLTPEILEKNGFKWLLTDSKYITYCINKPTVNASKNKENGEWLICVGPSGSTKKRFVEISCVKYVHELQHALRLSGIKKEIEI